MIPWLEKDDPFPPVEEALKEADGAPGLLAAGADLSPERLLDAYRRGIFPWFSEGQPILWWSTDPRMVLHLSDLHLSHNLRKKLRKLERERMSGGAMQVRFDSAFEQVVRACAEPRKDAGGTWISNEIVAGYVGLHRMGFAHSSEIWLNGELVGGAYGVCIGKMFYGESMFARVSDASKLALVYLAVFLHARGVSMIDCQQETEHLASLGARPIPRAAFLEHLAEASRKDSILDWQPLAPFGQDGKIFCE